MASIESVTLDVADPTAANRFDAGPFTDPDGFAWEAASLTCSPLRLQDRRS